MQDCNSDLNWLILTKKYASFEKIFKEKFKNFPLDNRIHNPVVLNSVCSYSNSFRSELCQRKSGNLSGRKNKNQS